MSYGVKGLSKLNVMDSINGCGDLGDCSEGLGDYSKDLVGYN